jgi:integrase
MAVLNLPPLPDRLPAQSYLGRLSPRSRPTMRSSLRTLAELLGSADPDEVAWEELRYQDTSRLRNQLVERYAASTAKRHLAALRGVLKQCWRLQLTKTDAYLRAVDLEPPPRLDAAPRRALSAQEVRALLDVCRDGSRWGDRDLALLSLMVSTAARRSEAAQLALADFDAVSGRIVVRHAKGGRTRELWLPPSALGALLQWIRIRGDWPGPLFPRSRGPGAGAGRLSGEAVNQLLARRARAAGIGHCTAHTLRRTALTALLDSDLDLASVSQVAGHANTQTTAMYDCRLPRAAGLAAAKAMERLLSP